MPKEFGVVIQNDRSGEAKNENEYLKQTCKEDANAQPRLLGH